ncbi:MAG: mechanosensitive ion channel family protein [Zetaproteobacteria bacterium]|nr:MAG: mechanosensitive ion channel family protein [Zetaproteobacteria bacterium]
MDGTWLHTTLLSIPLGHWLAAALALFATVVAQRYLVVLFHRLAQRVADRTETPIDNMLLEAAEKPAGWLVLVVGVMVSLHLLAVDPDRFPLFEPVMQLGRALTVVIGGWFLWRLIGGMAGYASARAAATDSPLDDQLIPFIAKTLRLLVIITGVLMVAQNLGYSVSGLIASLGIGGIAVAMAARDTLANVFGSIMILIDRPFTVGDCIKTSDFEGVVEEVGFRSTRIRTFGKTLVNVPNSRLANMVIDNIDARSKRRIKMRIGVTYDTTPEQMEQAIAGIERILREHPGVDQEYWLVKFDDFDDSALSIFLYYFSASKVLEEYLQVRQEVNLRIMRLLASLGIDFAFPSRTVYLRRA